MHSQCTDIRNVGCWSATGSADGSTSVCHHVEQGTRLIAVSGSTSLTIDLTFTRTYFTYAYAMYVCRTRHAIIAVGGLQCSHVAAVSGGAEGASHCLHCRSRFRAGGAPLSEGSQGRAVPQLAWVRITVIALGVHVCIGADNHYSHCGGLSDEHHR